VHDIDLAENHSADLNIPWFLENSIQERGYSGSIELAHHLDAPFDFLLLKPGEREEKSREVFLQEFGR